MGQTKERWKKIFHKELAIDYFVSTEGRVACLNGDGYFREIKPTICPRSGYLLVALLTNKIDKIGRKKYDSLMVARLTLQHFVGGYYNKRVWQHKDNDKLNCKLRNLIWKYGFPNGIDLNWVSNLNTQFLSADNLLVKLYLETGMPIYVWQLIINQEPVLRTIFNINRVYKHFGDWKQDCLEKMLNFIDSGRMMPNHIGAKFHKDEPGPYIRSYARMCCLQYIKHEVKNRVFEVQEQIIAKNANPIYSEMISDESACIEDEVAYMFAFFSN